MVGQAKPVEVRSPNAWAQTKGGEYDGKWYRTWVPVTAMEGLVATGKIKYLSQAPPVRDQVPDSVRAENIARLNAAPPVSLTVPAEEPQEFAEPEPEAAAPKSRKGQ